MTEQDLAGRRAVVTGGASGIGLACAEEFAARGAHLRDQLQGAKFREPAEIFEKEKTVDLGGVRVKLMRLGPAHTRGDTAVFVEGDAVLFSDEAERVYQKAGLAAFTRHEIAHALKPLPPGPFKPLLEALHRLQAAAGTDVPMRIQIGRAHV